MKKIAIITDSSADITEELAQELGIYVLRLPLVIDGKQYLEEIDISTEEFMNKMRNGSIAKTSSPLFGTMISLWEELLESHDEVIYVPISSGLSGTYNTAYAASLQYEGKVVVINAKFVCHPLTKLCVEIKNMANKGYSAVGIKDIVETQAEMWACLMPENLTALMRGGRISPAVAALGNLLKIVPLLKVENGAIDVQEKVRTHKKAYSRAAALCTAMENKDDYEFMVVNAGLPEEATKLANHLSELVGKEVEIHPMHPVIMSHCGPGTLACGWYRKLKY